MSQSANPIVEELAALASSLQQKRTGHLPKSVTVVLSEDTLVVTLYGALTPAEQALTRTPEGTTKVQEFHRQLFANSNDEMCREITRITGRQIRESAAEVEANTGTVMHAFSTGSMVQIFLLANGHLKLSINEQFPLQRAENEGLAPVATNIMKPTNDVNDANQKRNLK